MTKVEQAEMMSTRERITGWPEWWNSHGLQIQVKDFDPKNHLLVLQGGKTASLKFSLAENGDWNLDWEIIHNVPAGEKAGGRVCLDIESIREAFGLLSSNLKDPLVSKNLISRFNADSGRFGKYIRKGEYLNIPGPGVGHIGDPNLSIHLDQDIKSAVAGLLVTQR